MVAALYILLAAAMFFFQDTYFSVGGMELSLKNPCALAIIFLALLNFTVTARLGRAAVLARHTAVQMLPRLVPLVFSAIIWVASQAEANAVLNGVSMIIPQLLAIVVAAAAVYLFGSRGIWYCLGAMCAANFISVLTVIAEGGLDEFLRELFALLITFSGETGPLMVKLETHDLTFAFGPFLLYLLLNRKEIRHPVLWLTVSSFFFLIGLKRIAIPAIALGFLAAWLLRLLPERAARQTALCAGIGLMIFSFLYIVGIRYGLFSFLEEYLEINTMGRVRMFENLEPYYDISFTYVGKGTGFERFVDWASGEVFPAPRQDAMQIHNDFLRMYMNIGFIGYWVWLWSWLIVRLRYWFRQGGKKAGSLFFAICVYCFVLYATDNAIYYPYTMAACSLVPMAFRVEELEEEALEKYRAHWRRMGGGD